MHKEQRDCFEKLLHHLAAAQKCVQVYPAKLFLRLHVIRGSLFGVHQRFILAIASLGINSSVWI